MHRHHHRLLRSILLILWSWMMTTQTSAILRALATKSPPQMTTQCHPWSKLNNFPPIITQIVRTVQTASLSNVCLTSKSRSHFHHLVAHAISSNNSLQPQAVRITSNGAVQLTRCLTRAKRSSESLKIMTRRQGSLLEAAIICTLEWSSPNLCAPIKSFLAGFQQTLKEQRWSLQQVQAWV